MASALRAEISELEDGEPLGSEEELVKRMGVSRPTFRLAAKLMQQEQILTIRRGPGGGFFSKKPTTKAVAHMAAVFLQGRHVTLKQVMLAFWPLFVDIARWAVQQPDSTLLPLKAFLASERAKPNDNSYTIAEYLSSESAFHHIYPALGGNAVTELFYRTCFDFSATLQHETIYNDLERVLAYRAMRTRLCEAILARDGKLATVFAARLNEALINDLQFVRGHAGRASIVLKPAEH
ncbi:MAG: GntR family transcriptional regulator [Steroidobacteraceae bacterium]